MYRAAAAAAAAAISRSSSSVVRRELARGGVCGGAEQRSWARRFAAKEVSFGIDARAAILRGVNDLADSVKGPKVIFERGVTVAKSMELDDSAKNVGASLVKQVADAANTAAGDGGTTCASVHMEGCKTTSVVTAHLKCEEWMIDSTDEINQETEYPLILIHDKKVSNMNSLLPALQISIQNRRPLLICAEDVDGEALSMLVLNKPLAGLKTCDVKAPGFGENRRANWHDMAVLTGGQLGRRFGQQRLFTTSASGGSEKNKNNGHEQHKGKQKDFTFFEMLKCAINSLLSEAKSLLDGEGAFTELQRLFLVLVLVLSAVQYGCFRVLEAADVHHAKVDDRFAVEETKLEAWRNERELALVSRKRDAALFAAEEAEIRCEESASHARNLEKNLAMLGRDIHNLSGEAMEVKWLLTAVGGPKED